MKNSKKERCWELMAFILAVMGILVIIVFLFLRPFNDWSWNRDAELFGQYGDFVGGLGGTLISLSAFCMLYLTLKAQRDDITAQKDVFDEERFEHVFFKMIENYQKVKDALHVSHIERTENGKSLVSEVKGIQFFCFAKNELLGIYASLFSSDADYIDDETSREELERALDDVMYGYDLLCEDRYEKENKARNVLKIYLTSKFYSITKEKRSRIRIKEDSIKFKYIYFFFHLRYYYIVDSYFNSLFSILEYMENCRNKNYKFLDEEGINRYISFVRTQMSHDELTILFYYALDSPRMMEYVCQYNLLQDMCIEDLLDSNHQGLINCKLKPVSDFFKDE